MPIVQSLVQSIAEMIDQRTNSRRQFWRDGMDGKDADVL